MFVASSTINERGLSWRQFYPRALGNNNKIEIKRKPVLFPLRLTAAVTFFALVSIWLIQI